TLRLRLAELLYSASALAASASSLKRSLIFWVDSQAARDFCSCATPSWMSFSRVRLFLVAVRMWPDTSPSQAAALSTSCLSCLLSSRSDWADMVAKASPFSRAAFLNFRALVSCWLMLSRLFSENLGDVIAPLTLLHSFRKLW